MILFVSPGTWNGAGGVLEDQEQLLLKNLTRHPCSPAVPRLSDWGLFVGYIGWLFPRMLVAFMAFLEVFGSPGSCLWLCLVGSSRPIRTGVRELHWSWGGGGAGSCVWTRAWPEGRQRKRRDRSEESDPIRKKSPGKGAPRISRHIWNAPAILCPKKMGTTTLRDNDPARLLRYGFVSS